MSEIASWSAPSRLPASLRTESERIERIAREHGLDFHPVAFELLDARDVNGIAAYGGFPVRYPSWRHGMEFERLDKGYAWGMSKIYELVINTNPVVAYLVKSNSKLEQKLVMAHVFGHADFFKHNCWFAATDRRMLDTMGTHSTVVRRSIDAHGLETVERFLDQALSIENLIDPYLPLRAQLSGDGEEAVGRGAPPYQGGDPAEPRTYDVMGFLAWDPRVAERLEPWQIEILRIVRAEAYYFQPQRMTKIMNEGWASFWHSRMLTGGILDASEIVDFADCHSSATQQAPGQLNPYKLGIELFRHAEEHGQDIFRLRRIHNDASLIDELVDEEFVERQELFLYGKNTRSGRTELVDRDWHKVKSRLLLDLSWGGLPQIELARVEDDELVFVHHHDGRDLQLAQARETLRRVGVLWQRPVHLLTLEEGQGRRITCKDGEVTVMETQRDASGDLPDAEDSEEG